MRAGRCARAAVTGTAAGALLIALAAGPSAAQAPISDVHVTVSSAAVRGYRCGRRPFRFELAGAIGARYRMLGRGMATEGWDVRPMLLGACAMALMAPMAVLSVPIDLAAGPFRKDCEFELQARGQLVKWAGPGAGQAHVEAAGSNLVEPGEGSAARYFETRAATESDAKGRFSLALPGRVGRSPEFWIQWSVNGLASGRMALRKGWGAFTLSEPEPEFGASLDEMEPIELRPVP